MPVRIDDPGKQTKANAIFHQDHDELFFHKLSRTEVQVSAGPL